MMVMFAPIVLLSRSVYVDFRLAHMYLALVGMAFGSYKCCCWFNYNRHCYVRA